MEDPWPSKAILLTGGAGFIGSATLRHLVPRYSDCTFICLDRLAYSSESNLMELHEYPNFVFIKGNITSLDFVVHLIRSYNIDTILHFAAQTHVDTSFGHALDFTIDNVLGTHVLLEACRACEGQIVKFIHVSTDEVYGEVPLGDPSTFIEESSLAPSNPYAATKAAAEHLVQSYAASFKLPVIISRGNNVYGPRQFPEKLIPKFISLINEARPCPIHGSGMHQRSFVYIDDVARAFELIVSKGVVGEIYNVGVDFELNTCEVLQSILNEMVKDSTEHSRYFRHVEDRPFNDVRYRIDVSKLTSLGWKPDVEFSVGLKRTVEWYRQNPDYFGDVSDVLNNDTQRKPCRISNTKFITKW